MSDTAHRALVADIGGTNTRVALAEGGILLPGSARRYRNSTYEGLVPVLRQFLEETGSGVPQAAALAMAGPVHDGRGTLTNLDWDLDVDVLAEATGASTVALLNDLQAQGYAIGHLPRDSQHVVLPGTPPDHPDTQLVVGIGTGFNTAPVFYTAQGRYVPPSETGHATLPARTPEDLALVDYITAEHGFCSIEDALSGRGLGAIHDFLCARDGTPTGAKSAAIMAALTAPDADAARRAEEAIGIFVRLSAGVCGDLALTLLPFGGVFLAGGMARAITPHLAKHDFGKAFRDKGRFSAYVAQFSVTTILDDDAALIGSAHHLDALRLRGGPG